jgi:hypothetical protein
VVCSWTSLICHSLQVSSGIFKWKQIVRCTCRVLQ